MVGLAQRMIRSEGMQNLLRVSSKPITASQLPQLRAEDNFLK